MTNLAETDAYTVAIFKAVVKLSAATDTCYVLARDIEDAVKHIYDAYDEFNVLYFESVERLAGMVFISPGAKQGLLEAFG